MALTVPDQGEASNDLQSVLSQSTIDALVAGVGRTGVVSGCAVTQRAAGANMSVDVAAGRVTVGATSVAVSATNVAVTTADATNPRLDLVVVNGSGVVSVLAGTAAAAPVEPTLDTTTYVALAQVYVPAAATTVTTARITDRRLLLGFPGVGVFGDGSDGAVTISSNTTLTRDMYYSSLTVNTGVTLKPTSWRVFVAGTLTNNGTIDASGGNGTASTGSSGGGGGAAGGQDNATIGMGTSGGTGSISGAGGNAGSFGAFAQGSLVGANVTGATGGTGSSGAGGTGTLQRFMLGTTVSPFRNGANAALGAGWGSSGAWAKLGGGPGGGAGAGDATNRGGGGGGGGGPMVIAAVRLAGSGTFASNGGNGGAAGTGNTGGGAGGSGGSIAVLTQDASAWTGTISVAAGTGGTGIGTGTAGGNGSAGASVLVTVP